jgi:CDP-diacylglycerol---serine O-phosphatidyltransferase
MLSYILRQVDLANFLTLIGLSFSFNSAVFAIQGNLYASLVLMMYAGIIDLFDGFVARRIQRTELQSQVGKQLDSIVDVCSFGFAPAIFAYCFGLQNPLSIVVLILFVGATALRLAYFNSTGLLKEGSEEYFTGLPVTYTALFIPLIFTSNFVFSDSTMKILVNCLYLLLAIAMVANFKMLKLTGIWYRLFPLGALILTGVYSWAIITGR